MHSDYAYPVDGPDDDLDPDLIVEEELNEEEEEEEERNRIANEDDE